MLRCLALFAGYAGLGSTLNDLDEPTVCDHMQHQLALALTALATMSCTDLDHLHPLTFDPGRESTSSSSDPDGYSNTSHPTDSPTGEEPGCSLMVEYIAPDSTMCTDNSCDSARPFARARHNCNAADLATLLLQEPLFLHNADADVWSPAAIVPEMQISATCVILMWGLQHRAAKFTLSRSQGFEAEDVIVSWPDVDGYVPGLHAAVIREDTEWHVSGAPPILPTCF